MKYEVFGRVCDASHKLEVGILLPERRGKIRSARDGLRSAVIIDKHVLSVDGRLMCCVNPLVEVIERASAVPCLPEIGLVFHELAKVGLDDRALELTVRIYPVHSRLLQ